MGKALVEAVAAPSPIEQRRRSQILRAVIDVVSEDGFDGATMRKIADRAGVSTGMLTYYYRNKNDLITDAIRVAYLSFTGVVNAQVGPEYGPGRVKAFFERMVSASRTDVFPPTFWLEYWAQAARDPSLRTSQNPEVPRAREVFRLCVEAGIRGGELRQDLDPDQCADLLTLTWNGARVELGIQNITEARVLDAVDYALKLMTRV